MDRIDLLENRVRDMIALVQTLRDENRTLRDELEAQQSRLSGLTAEQRVIDEERDLLRDRIERMLRDMESLDAAGKGESGKGKSGKGESGKPGAGKGESDRPRPEEVDLNAPTQPITEFAPLGSNPPAVTPSSIELGADATQASAAPPRSKRAESRTALREEAAPAPVAPAPAAAAAATALHASPDDTGHPGSDPAHPLLPGFM